MNRIMTIFCSQQCSVTLQYAHCAMQCNVFLIYQCFVHSNAIALCSIYFAMQRSVMQCNAIHCVLNEIQKITKNKPIYQNWTKTKILNCPNSLNLIFVLIKMYIALFLCTCTEYFMCKMSKILSTKTLHC